MSLEQVESFFEMLSSEPEIYRQYYNNCCRQGFFSSCHWDTKKIVNFAITLGYRFTESELEELLFVSQPIHISK
ncbi:Nif11-like leader peptide family natural product precursor [Anabaena sp. PCC 7108]|uniref:Nif11-like leader peptide family natural product precursor n=1 Tax=Anabaena sp. PCC 7108 TaxID=163908 RepID=UPI00034A91AA|nr:Nif11-like leader peptide family natural product precursor [Anabaena sp. PCC 7108]